MVFCHDRPWVVETPGITWAAGAALWGEEAMETAAWHARRLADALIPTRPGLVFHGHLHIRYPPCGSTRAAQRELRALTATLSPTRPTTSSSTSVGWSVADPAGLAKCQVRSGDCLKVNPQSKGVGDFADRGEAWVAVGGERFV